MVLFSLPPYCYEIENYDYFHGITELKKHNKNVTDKEKQVCQICYGYFQWLLKTETNKIPILFDPVVSFC